MNNDIRISCSFPEHYKTKKLMAIAGNAAPFKMQVFKANYLRIRLAK